MARLPSVPLELVLAFGLVGAAWSAHLVNARLDAFAQQAIETGEVGSLPDGRVVRVAALGFERLVADLYWIRSVFYVGSEGAREANYPGAEALANLITDIDPRFHSVYVLMSSVLSGLRFDSDAAIRLLEKGVRNSDYWRIYFLLGFEYFMEKGDYQKGARYLQAAYEHGGPSYLPLLVSRLYAHGGDPETAVVFLRQRLQNEKHPRIRKRLERRLRDAMINRDLALLQAAVDRFAAERGALPADVGALVVAGYLKKAPVDPTGTPYLVRGGRAVSQTEYEVLRLKE
jgi:hypothetical protein